MAYFVPSSEPAPAAIALRHILSETLPDYMVLQYPSRLGLALEPVYFLHAVAELCHVDGLPYVPCVLRDLLGDVAGQVTALPSLPVITATATLTKSSLLYGVKVNSINNRSFFQPSPP